MRRRLRTEEGEKNAGRKGEWEGDCDHDDVNPIRDHSVRVEGVYDSVGEAEKSAKHFENDAGGSNANVEFPISKNFKLVNSVKTYSNDCKLEEGEHKVENELKFGLGDFQEFIWLMMNGNRGTKSHKDHRVGFRLDDDFEARDGQTGTITSVDKKHG